MDLSKLPAAPRDEGVLRRILARPAPDERLVLDQAVLDVTFGVPGDRWHDRFTQIPDRYRHSQVSVMRFDVAQAFADDADADMDGVGDNLLVDLDLSWENLPVGSLLGIGAARLRVTPKLHTGCAKFRARFGDDALKSLKSMERARGLFLQVEVPGCVAVGDAIVVLERAKHVPRKLPG